MMILEIYNQEEYFVFDSVNCIIVITEQKSYSIFSDHTPMLINLINSDIEYFLLNQKISHKFTDLNGILLYIDNKIKVIFIK